MVPVVMVIEGCSLLVASISPKGKPNTQTCEVSRGGCGDDNLSGSGSLVERTRKIARSRNSSSATTSAVIIAAARAGCLSLTNGYEPQMPGAAIS